MITYIIATYSNIIKSRIGHYKNSENVLQLQFEQLYKIFTEKKKLNIKNLIEKIIVVCPESKEKRNMSYYKYDIWTKNFKNSV